MTIDEGRTPDREILGWHEFGEANFWLAIQVQGAASARSLPSRVVPARRIDRLRARREEP
jgi:hypothetical protein